MKISMKPISVPLLSSLGGLASLVIHGGKSLVPVIGMLVGIWLCYGGLRVGEKIKED